MSRHPAPGRHSSEGGPRLGNRPVTTTSVAAQRAEVRAHPTALVDPWTVVYLVLLLALTMATTLAARSAVDLLASTSRCIGATS